MTAVTRPGPQTSPRERPIKMTLEFASRAEPIGGSLLDEGGESRRFAGWLGLLAALDAALSGDHGARAEER